MPSKRISSRSFSERAASCRTTARVREEVFVAAPNGNSYFRTRYCGEIPVACPWPPSPTNDA
jgi:hypothetical protein